MQKIVFLMILFLFLNFVNAQTVSHNATQIKSGTFGQLVGGGNYVFPDSLGIGVYPIQQLTVYGDVNFTGVLVQGSVPWSRLTNYPSPCQQGFAVQAIGSTLTCIQINTTPGVSNITSVSAGAGLTGGGSSGNIQLALNSSYESGSIYDQRFVNEGQSASGDITGNFSNLQLSTTGVIEGVYGSPSQSAQVLVDSKGRIVSANNTTISITASQITSGTISNALLDNNIYFINSSGLSASNITSGALSISTGGTGASSALQARINLNVSGTGNCPEGYVTMNLTTDGPECVQLNSLSGSGNPNTIPVWSSSSSLSNSIISQSGSNIGIDSPNPSAKLEISGSSPNGVSLNVSNLLTFSQYSNTLNLTTGSILLGRLNAQTILGLSYNVSSTPIFLLNESLASTQKPFINFRYMPNTILGRISGLTIGSKNVFLVEGGLDRPIAFSSNSSSTPHLFIDTTGYVGIGSTSPANALDVVGTINATQAVCIANDCRTVWPGGASANAWIMSGSLLYNNTAGVKVGIGSTSPANALDVVGTINATQAVCIANDCRTAWPTFNSSSEWVVFGSNLYVNTTDMKVGIGTPTPKSKLEVNGTGTNLLSLNVSDVLFVNDTTKTVGINTMPDVNVLKLSFTDSSAPLFLVNQTMTTSTRTLVAFRYGVNTNLGRIVGVNVNSEPTIIFMGASDRPVGISANSSDTPHIFVATNGSVGIGTTKPGSYKLYVNGSSYFDSLNIGGNLELNNYIALNDSILLFPPDWSGYSEITRLDSLDGNDYLRIWSNIIFLDANVGIGTSSPKTKLEVLGDINASRFYDLNNSNYYLDPAGNSYLNNIISYGDFYSEGFEGTFPPTNWTTGGNSNWNKNTTIFYEGTASASSGNIGDSQNSWIDIDRYFSNDGYISFYWRVSSESSYDYLVFCVDNDSGCSISSGYVDRISGSVNWQKKTYNVSKGMHSFRWLYGKDTSQSSGEDKAYIDKVEFIDGGYVYANYMNTTDFYATNIFADQKLGIGTKSPASRFHIQWSSTNCGTQCFSDAAVFENNGNVFLQLMGSSGGEKSINFAKPTNGADGAIKYNYALVPNGFSFWTNGNVFRVSIDQNGNLGINTSSPTSLLEIKGTGPLMNVSNTSTSHIFVNGTSGNVGIGTNKPLMNLEISGGLMLNTTNPKPNCDQNIRGTLWFEKTDQENDKMYVCMRNSTGSYNWILVAVGGINT